MVASSDMTKRPQHKTPLVPRKDVCLGHTTRALSPDDSTTSRKLPTEKRPGGFRGPGDGTAGSRCNPDRHRQQRLDPRQGRDVTGFPRHMRLQHGRKLVSLSRGSCAHSRARRHDMIDSSPTKREENLSPPLTLSYDKVPAAAPPWRSLPHRRCSLGRLPGGSDNCVPFSGLSNGMLVNPIARLACASG
ncbi:hypothetical protein LX36DRAFT_663431 [Colletotrichum falcatum]|nr:hypothetical protein LX36DRAFT_663431 [Colletotrichum falcatum]